MTEKSQPEARKDIYHYLADQGFEMTRERHEALKALMKYVKPLEPAQIVQHNHTTTVTCRSCGGKGVFMGRHWRPKAAEVFNVEKKK